MPAECLEYLKHITNKLISVGMEPPIGLKLHNELFALGPPLSSGLVRVARYGIAQNRTINLYILIIIIKVQALLIQLPDVIVEIYSSW